MKIIGLCGAIGSGKSLTAALLGMAGFDIRSFAEPLRKEVAWALRNNDHPPGAPQCLFLARADDVRAKPTPPAMRELLQWWGTEYRRAQDENYWVKKANFNSPGVFQDVRFPNEAAAVRASGGIMWRISRPAAANQDHADHSSETIAVGIAAEVTVLNDGPLEHYVERVREALMLSERIRGW